MEDGGEATQCVSIGTRVQIPQIQAKSVCCASSVIQLSPSTHSGGRDPAPSSTGDPAAGNKSISWGRRVPSVKLCYQFAHSPMCVNMHTDAQTHKRGLEISPSREKDEEKVERERKYQESMGETRDVHVDSLCPETSGTLGKASSMNVT